MQITLKENETMQDLVDRLYESASLVYGIAPVAYWYENLHEDGRIKDIQFSDHMREKLGYKSTEDFPDDLKAFITFLHPDDVQPMLDNAIAAGTGKTDKYDLQYRIRKADGEYMWCHATGELVKDHKGTTVGMYGAFIDITEEVELREKTLVESLAEAYMSLYQVNLNSGYYTVLKKTDTVPTGYTEEGKEFYKNIAAWINDEIYPEDRAIALKACAQDNIRKQFETVRSYSVNIRHNRYNNRYREMRFVRASDYEETSNFFLSFIDNHEYIIAQKKAKDQETELQNEKHLKEAMVEQMSIMMEVSDDFQAIYDVDYETGRYEIYSYDNNYADSVLKDNENGNNFYADTLKDVRRVVHPDDQQLIIDTFSNKEYIGKTLAAQGRFSIDYRLLIEGIPTWHRVNATKKKGDSNRFLIGIFNIDERIRKEKETQSALEEALKMAQSANQAKTAFLNSMSHDIRTPLNAITGYTAMAKKHMDNSGSVTDYLNKIDVSGHQLLELINQVLEMSRIESGKVVLKEEPADVIDRAYAMRTLSGTDIESKNLKYTVIIKDVPHRFVLADGSRMNQLILNIIGNAIKYTPEGGSIDYTVEEKPCDKEGYGLYSFTVADTGIGMSEEFQKHIFEEFARENTSTVSHIQGTGLGMPIVKKIVDLMGGSIDVKSKLGEGTTITVSVPMKWDAHAESRAVEQAKHHNMDFNGKRLLLVEDNEMNREIAIDILEDAGFNIECAEDGDIAVEKVKNDNYDAVLMDIQMPRMNGYEATMAIRALPDSRYTHLPIIALSANAFEEDRQKSLDAGMDDHVSKPIDINQLKETLAKYL